VLFATKIRADNLAVPQPLDWTANQMELNGPQDAVASVAFQRCDIVSRNATVGVPYSSGFPDILR
jgi:hypothetical protein